MSFEIILIILCVLLAALILVVKFSKKQIQKENSTLKQKLDEALKGLELFRKQELYFIEEKSKLLAQNEILKAKLDEKEQFEQKLFENYRLEKEKIKEEHHQNLKNLEQKFEQNLKNQSQNLLNQNKLILGTDIKKLLEEIFTPISQSVKEYKQKLSENEIALKTNIENMFKFSQNIGANADKLAKILKGDKKIRGNFAELRLQNVLENSGLIEGEQYKLQASFKENDKNYIADAVVFLDHQKSIIIDAKFSLPNDFSFEELNSQVCKELALNLKARIDELAKKPYANFDTHTYDFVLLFIPYQNILDLVLSVESSIYQYAYERKIYLTTPNTLFMALNTIHISWKHISANDNIQKAFEELGKFHDKFALVLEDFEKIKNASKSLNNHLENMENKLLNGSGNLNTRIAKLEQLGAKVRKKLPKQGE